MVDSRPVDPKLNDVWIDTAGKLMYYDGKAWVPYLSPPGADKDLPPGMLEETDLPDRDTSEGDE